MDQPGTELSGTWAATIADEALRRVFFEPSYDDHDWEPVALPGHWRTHPGVRGRPTARCCTGVGSTHPNGPRSGRRRAQLARLRRHLLPRGRVARRRVPRRHRGLLLPSRVRHHRAHVGPRRAPPRGRGRVRAGRPTAPRSATSPASSSTGTASTPTGTPVASGVRCGSSAQARCGSAACACSAARPMPRGRSSRSSPTSTATRRARSPCARRSPASRSRASSTRSPRA